MVTNERTETGCAILDNNTLEWAAYYDIPIIELDCKSYYESALLDFKQSLQEIKKQTVIPSIQEILKLCEQKMMVDCFSKKTITDGYTLMMNIINLDNKVWDLENVLRLENILNLCFSDEKMIVNEIYNSSNYTEEQKSEIKKTRTKKIKELKEKVNLYLQAQEIHLVGKNK